MTLYEFNQLSPDAKVSFAFDHCVFLMRYAEDSQHSATLYYCKAARFRAEYFIEVWYNSGDGQVDSIVSFMSTRRLGPYLAQVGLEGLE